MCFDSDHTKAKSQYWLPHLVAHGVTVVSFLSHGRAHTQAADPQTHRTAHPSSTLRVLLTGLHTHTYTHTTTHTPMHTSLDAVN